MLPVRPQDIGQPLLSFQENELDIGSPPVIAKVHGAET